MIYTFMGGCIGFFIFIVGIINLNILLILWGFLFGCIGFLIIIPQCIPITYNKIFIIIISIFLGLLFISAVFMSVKIHLETPSNKDICLLEYPESPLENCVNNIKGLNVCSKINATYIKTNYKFFSSPIYICNLNGTIIQL